MIKQMKLFVPVIFLLMMAAPLFEGAEQPIKAAHMGAAGQDPGELSCIPLWARDWPSPVQGEQTTSLEPYQVDPLYQSLTEVQLTSDRFCSYFDKDLGVTRVFVGDYPNNRVLVHNIQKDLIGYSQILPISYGKTWLIEDLDLDGNMDLVLQRGDPGFGGNGYLDIHSAPNWELKAHIVLTNMKIYFYPVAVNVDGDNYLELYLSPAELFGSSHVMVVQYDPEQDTYIVTDHFIAPPGHGGHTAAGDFDTDGKTEFITGNYDGYGLFEYENTVEPSKLIYKGVIPGSHSGNWASSLRPYGSKRLHVLLGHSSGSVGYSYQLLKPNGNNTFEIVQVFTQDTGWFGIHPSFVLDDDNDNMDEFCLNFYPETWVYEWDPTLGQFVHIWTWNQFDQGTFVWFNPTDVDQDGSKEYGLLNHNNLLRFFERQ